MPATHAARLPVQGFWAHWLVPVHRERGLLAETAVHTQPVDSAQVSQSWSRAHAAALVQGLKSDATDHLWPTHEASRLAPLPWAQS